MSRTLSFSEVSRALDCQARWDFTYSDRLAGSSLKPKVIAPILSSGRAFGAAVAAYHVALGKSQLGGPATVFAMDASLEADADEQREHGVHDDEQHKQLRTDLLRILIHYTDTIEQFAMEPLTERELDIPLPSRTGIRSSNAYRLRCYLDGTMPMGDDLWLVEFKLRNQLSSVELIQLNRQIRWYSYAFWVATGIKPAGVQVVERWNKAPVPARVLKSGKPSHAKDQLTTPAMYADLCQECEEPVDGDTFAALDQRRWQQVVPIMFRDGELEEAGQELVSAAKLIHQLDNGDLLPLRNAKPANCNGCPFKGICPAPDPMLVDAMFTRQPPKRERNGATP